MKKCRFCGEDYGNTSGNKYHCDEARKCRERGLMSGEESRKFSKKYGLKKLSGLDHPEATVEDDIDYIIFQLSRIKDSIVQQHDSIVRQNNTIVELIAPRLNKIKNKLI